jgi:hypothetical protein
MFTVQYILYRNACELLISSYYAIAYITVLGRHSMSYGYRTHLTAIIV